MPARIFTTDIAHVSRISEPKTVPMGLVQDLASVRDVKSAQRLTSEGGPAGADPATLLPESGREINVGVESAPTRVPSPANPSKTVRSVTGVDDHYSIHQWMWLTLLLNLLVYLFLGAEAVWESGELSAAGNTFLALWPGLLVGLWVVYIYRPLYQNTLLWSICWGVLFGITDVVLAALVCYTWTALALTIPHWGYDWLEAGDGLRIFFDQVKLLLPVALKYFVLGLWVVVTGGALIGFFVGRSHIAGSKRQ